MVVSVLAVRTVPGLPMVGFQPHEVYMEAGPAPPLPPAAEVGSVVVKSLPSLGVAPHPNDPLGSWAEHEYVEHHRPRRRIVRVASENASVSRRRPGLCHAGVQAVLTASASHRI